MKDLRFLRFVITPAQTLCFSLHVYKILGLNSRLTVLKKIQGSRPGNKGNDEYQIASSKYKEFFLHDF